MTDPTNALQSVYFDRPKGGSRFTYVRLEDTTVTAFVGIRFVRGY
jgi:hypothetical protein